MHGKPARSRAAVTMISTSYWGPRACSRRRRGTAGCRGPPRRPRPCSSHRGLDVGEPDVGGQELGLVGAGLRQQPVDQAEDVLGLLGDRLAARIARDLAREIDGVAMTTIWLIRGPTSTRLMLIACSSPGFGWPPRLRGRAGLFKARPLPC